MQKNLDVVRVFVIYGIIFGLFLMNIWGFRLCVKCWEDGAMFLEDEEQKFRFRQQLLIIAKNKHGLSFRKSK